METLQALVLIALAFMVVNEFVSLTYFHQYKAYVNSLTIEQRIVRMCAQVGALFIVIAGAIEIL